MLEANDDHSNPEKNRPMYGPVVVLPGRYGIAHIGRVQARSYTIGAKFSCSFDPGSRGQRKDGYPA
jgi:hypothetical protein